MKVFVAGGTGVLGTRVVRLLVENGYDVSVIARSDPKAAVVRAAGAAPAAVSLFDAEALTAAVAGHDAVVNVATHIPPFTKAGSAKAWRENDHIRTDGVRNLVDAAIAAGAARYVQESLAFVYADHGEAWIDEHEPVIPSSYTATAALAEEQVNRFTASGGVGVALRFGQFYAADASHSQSFLKGARRGWSLMIGPADAYTVTIAADDAASAVLAALDPDGAPAGIYHVVDDDPVTRREWAQIMAAAVGRSKLRLLPGFVVRLAAKRAPNLVTSQRVSNAAFKRVTPWTPAYPSFREGVQVTLEAPASSLSRSGRTGGSR